LYFLRFRTGQTGGWYHRQRDAAADFNGDGKLDLAVANLTDDTVSILLQQ
jgi:FG-GAP repeat